jgi:hypothetical protein
VVSDAPEGDPAPSPEAGSERSRRQILSGGGGLLAATSVLLGGCTSKVKQPSNIHIGRHNPNVDQDAAALNALVALEYKSIAAYTACIPLLPQPAPPPSSPSQSPPAPPAPSNQPPPPLVLMIPLSYTAAQTFQSQELAHVTELKGFIGQTGQRLVKPGVSYDFGHPRTKVEALKLLHRTEQELLAGYLGVMALLSPKGLRGAAAAIFANHVQHSTILRLELGLPPNPTPFVSRPL